MNNGHGATRYQVLVVKLQNSLLNCVSVLKCIHAPYLLYMSYGGVHSSRACSIFTCDSATLSGGRWQTLTFISSVAMYHTLLRVVVYTVHIMLGAVCDST